MTTKLTRRDFLGLGLLSLGAAVSTGLRPFPPDDQHPTLGHGRICWDWLPVREYPSFDAPQAGRYTRDQLVNLLDVVESEWGPAYNPRWYKVMGGGWLFSGYVQRVQTILQPAAHRVAEGGQPGEITVPYSDTQRWTRDGWTPLYRLYYQSSHWVTGIDKGPDGKPWYEITDDLHRQTYFVRAAHVRLVPPDEMTPLSPDVPEDEKRIVVAVNDQTLTAYEGDEPVFHTTVSTGVPNAGSTDNGIPTDTPFGAFRIYRKMPVRHMGNGDLVADLSAYELPGVPWCMFFVSTGVAFHGAYWHDNFGRRMSHGCVNMRPDEAKWLYRWSLPASEPALHTEGAGTKVQVIL
jgi:hypothetical protein